MLGLDTFGDLTHDDDDRPRSHARTIRDIVDAGVLADRVGVDFFGIGEQLFRRALTQLGQPSRRARELLAEST